MPNLRLIPVVIFAALALLAIKTLGFVASVGPVQNSWNLETEVRKRVAGIKFGEADPIVTGATPETKPPEPAKAPPPIAALPKGGSSAKSKEPQSNSAAERALLERLQERRQELEARARDIEMRENLLKAAEKQIESKIGELKGFEEGKGEASERVKSLVVMYESMGPKEAARIFDRLDPKTLVDLVNHMNPRKVSEIMAKMQPEAAERMTLELARGKTAEKTLPASDLKRIDAKAAR
jgi:flagellar motility protein MotE (MotC chaperone)